jgi:DNA-binding Lrp family transcriptional regulator
MEMGVAAAVRVSSANANSTVSNYHSGEVGRKAAEKPGRYMALVHLIESLLDDESMTADEIAALVALVRYSNAKGECRPSQGKMAEQLGRSRPWVNKQIARLESAGYIEKTHRHLEKGGMTSCHYRLPDLDVHTVVHYSAQADRAQAANTPCHHRDSPCPVGDTNQAIHELKKISLSHVRESSPSRVLIHPDWQPSLDDTAWASVTKPEIKLAAFTKKFVSKLNAAGGTHRPPSLKWREWLVDEIAQAAKPPQKTARPRPKQRPAAPTVTIDMTAAPAKPGSAIFVGDAGINIAVQSIPAPIEMALREIAPQEKWERWEFGTDDIAHLTKALEPATAEIEQMFKPSSPDAIAAFLSEFSARHGLQMPSATQLEMDMAAISAAIPVDLLPIACRELWKNFGYRRLPGSADFIKAVDALLKSRRSAAARIKAVALKIGKKI